MNKENFGPLENEDEFGFLEEEEEKISNDAIKEKPEKIFSSRSQCTSS